MASAGSLAGGGPAASAEEAAPAGTDVSGILSADTTWTSDGGPYNFVGTVDVPAGVTLTIEAGTELTKSAAYLPGPMLRVAGTVQTLGTDAAPVLLSLPAGQYAQFVGPAPQQSTSVVRLDGLHATGSPAVWDGSAAFAEFSVTDSRFLDASVNLDNTAGDITFERNAISAGSSWNGSGLAIANPRPGHVSVVDNRFRESGLACRGIGRLNAPRNTYERSFSYPGSRVSSAEDCLLDVSGSHWETPDTQIGDRVQGSARVIVTPTSPSPSTATPTLSPAPSSIYRSSTPQGFPTLQVSPSSDGGLPTTLVAVATNRETGQVVETLTRPQPSWDKATHDVFTFRQLVPGTLYRLSSYAENALGVSVLRETESFIAPTPTQPQPDEEGRVGGTLTSDTTWTASDGPYVFADSVSVPEGVTLTIQSGAVLQTADDRYLEHLLSVAGTVLIQGTASRTVEFKSGRRYNAPALIASSSSSARIAVSGLHSDSMVDLFQRDPANGSPSGRFTEFALTDSMISGPLSVDASLGDVAVLRNAFDGLPYGPNSLEITNPRTNGVLIEDNRFRSGRVSCGGAGRLGLTRNTFERNTYLASNDDCVVNAAGNFWEAADAQAATRIQGRARVTFLPTTEAPSDATPALPPAQQSQYDYIDESGRATLRLFPGSDGGLPSTVVATATNRETGEVEATRSSAMGSWRTDNTATFVFDELTPGGLYRLSSYVENALGRSLLQESESFLAPQRAPAAPREVVATGSGTTATVTWTAPVTDNGNSVTGYTVTAEPGGQSITVPADVLRAVVPDLAHSTTYTFTVTASSAAGTSLASSPSNPITTAAPPVTDGGGIGGGGGGGGGGGTTPPTTPETAAKAPAAPTGVASNPGDGSASVSWSAGDDNGSAITGFNVTRFPGGATVTTAGDAKSVVFSDLTNGTAYTFVVSATNAAGTSAASAPSSPVVPAGRPGQPGDVTALRDDRSATVRWSSAEPNGSALTGYTVTASPGGATVTTAGDARSAVFSDLTNGTAYTFVVSATNVVGTSAASVPSSPVVPVGRPGQPGGVTAVRDDRSATVRWSSAESNGSSLTGYTVTASPGGATVVVGPQQTRAVVRGLTNGVAYTFAVTATNEMGEGVSSADSAPVVPAGSPGRVLKPKARLQGLGAVVTWTAPNSNGAPITGYVVTMSTGRTFNVSATDRKSVLKRVKAEVELRFKVRAVSSAGSGRVSEWSNVVVRQRD